jgi:hypothetical protein
MLHRHLNHEEFTPAAIDDVIARGGRRDWEELHQAIQTDHSLLQKILRICQARVADPYAQRHHFWMHYVKKHLA